jgi:hypothetical protein
VICKLEPLSGCSYYRKVIVDVLCCSLAAINTVSSDWQVNYAGTSALNLFIKSDIVPEFCKLQHSLCEFIKEATSRTNAACILDCSLDKLNTS